ncbi:unnamed protein product [Laminaria digitata]
MRVADMNDGADLSATDMSAPSDDMSTAPDQGADLLAIENTPEGNPLVPEHPLLPFPSDFFLVEDANTATGKNLALESEVVPKFLTAEMFDGVDGFSRIPPIITYLPGGYDPSTLPDPLDGGATLEDDASVFLLQGPDWERFPALVERDVNVEDDDDRALIIRPLRALDPETTYAVLVTNRLARADGEPHAPNAAFRALIEGTPTSSPELERERERFSLVEDAAVAQNLEMSQIVQGWTFTTRSEVAVTAPLLAMQRVAGEACLDAPTMTSMEVIDDGAVKVLGGTFEVENFVADDGYLALGEDGLPKSVGRREVEFMMTIPDSVTGPRPVIVFGHGFFSKMDEITYSSFKNLCKRYGFIAIAVNFEGFDEKSSGGTVTLLTNNTSQIDKLIAKQMQAYTHFTALARLVREQLVNTILSEDGANTPLIDASQVHYMGISNGATFGAVITATTGEFERAALVVGGGGLVHFLERAESWNALGPLFERRYDTALNLQVVLSLLQHKLDPIDSLNYAGRLTSDRFEGLGTLKASLHMAVNDSSVRNILTEIVAREAGVPVVSPSAKTIWGAQTVMASETSIPGQSALVVYDEGYPASPITNKAPEEDNGAHGSVRALDVYQEHIAAFIETGALIQVCDGACDPD